MSKVYVEFKKTGHFWLDAGLVGLIKTLKDMDCGHTKIQTTDSSLIIEGESDKVAGTLNEAYDHMVNLYYNTSSQKQKEECANFYYDEKTGQFIRFPKVKPMGIAGILGDIAARPSKDLVKWKSKKEKGILPQKYAHLQDRLDAFIKENNLSLMNSGMLLNGPNQVKPKLAINLKEGRTKKTCFICGQESSKLEEVNQTIFPFATGASGLLSFYTMADKPEKACWRCSLLGKFVPVNSFHMTQGEDTFAFIPYSASLTKMLYVYDSFQDIKYLDPNLFKNFEHGLGSYYQHPFESTFAFLYRLYVRMSLSSVAESNNETKQDDGDLGLELDIEQMYHLVVDKAPLELYILHFTREGNTFATKMIWPFRDTVYFFRLLQRLEQSVRMKKVLPQLVDYDVKDNASKTYMRNKILERMLKKQPIVDLVEQFIFHKNLNYTRDILELVKGYEEILKEGNPLLLEEQNAAIALGRLLGTAIAKSDNGKKGDLFALRRTKNLVSFLEQLNRLQFRLSRGFSVPNEVIEGKLRDDNFREFKSFCMIAALNSYNYHSDNQNQEK